MKRYPAKIPLQMTLAPAPGAICALCTMPYKDNNNVCIIQECAHYFHYSCIEYELKRQRAIDDDILYHCPSCFMQFEDQNQPPPPCRKRKRLKREFPRLVGTILYPGPLSRCDACYETFPNMACVRVVSECGHRFHEWCTLDAFEYQNKCGYNFHCPCCRTEITDCP